MIDDIDQTSSKGPHAFDITWGLSSSCLSILYTLVDHDAQYGMVWWPEIPDYNHSGCQLFSSCLRKFLPLVFFRLVEVADTLIEFLRGFLSRELRAINYKHLRHFCLVGPATVTTMLVPVLNVWLMIATFASAAALDACLSLTGARLLYRGNTSAYIELSTPAFLEFDYHPAILVLSTSAQQIASVVRCVGAERGKQSSLLWAEDITTLPILTPAML